ncbi:hypothetical protein [Aminobacter carboxidus]|uniref:Uncharacterized protein n=1 Tax=Aminobacter carboxidus TaxID=376165 RepID=A0ABR9GGX3_9HYPH|nr:hypothetical protein [Aminobacter carboxidus]MBE1202902.1 hypothetical protein [Aminobacter carboxidus]
MRLLAAFLVAGITASASVHASSIVIVEGKAVSPSSVAVDAPKSATRSIVEIGAPSVDTGKVAAIETKPASINHKMGPELMVIRGGEVGSASPEPASIAPASPDAAPAPQTAAEGQTPLPASSDGTVGEPAQAVAPTE